jgi:hypothetical protein
MASPMADALAVAPYEHVSVTLIEDVGSSQPHV